MEWQRFNGQKLELCDLVFLKENGLGFVDSSLTTKEPDRISSIPEGWSFGGGVEVNRRSAGKFGFPHIRKNGCIYRDRKYGGNKLDQILFICKMKKPII